MKQTQQHFDHNIVAKAVNAAFRNLAAKDGICTDDNPTFSNGNTVGLVILTEVQAAWLLDGQPFDIRFQATRGSRFLPSQIGALVQKALMAQGLATKWDGRSKTPIRVLGIHREIQERSAAKKEGVNGEKTQR